MNAIIVGASSGIGAALARVLVQNGYSVGMMARRTDLLDQLGHELGPAARGRPVDVTQTAEAMNALAELIATMGAVDLVVISAGTGFPNADLEWEPEKETIDVNVTGFAAMANVAMHHFLQRGRGHLVGITSIAALRGGGGAPAYNATKAFQSNYLDGLRGKVARLRMPIVITDVQPGFVDTAMAKADRPFWMASPEKAARQIYRAIRRRRGHVYVTRRWRLIAWLFKGLPNFLYDRLG